MRDVGGFHMKEWREILAHDKRMRAYNLLEQTPEMKAYRELEKQKIDEYEGDPDKFRKDYDLKKSHARCEGLPEYKAWKTATEEAQNIRWKNLLRGRMNGLPVVLRLIISSLSIC